MIISDVVEVSVEDSKSLLTFETVSALSIRIFESIYGVSQFSLTFYDRNIAPWNAFAEETDLTMRIRIGAKSNMQPSAIWSNWKQVRVTGVELTSTGNMFSVVLVGEDGLFDLKNQAPQRVFVMKTISEMIKQIASESNLSGGEIVESTDKYTLRQGQSSDYEFLQEELLPRLRAQDAEEVYFCYVKQTGEPQLTVSSLTKKATGEPKLGFRFAMETSESYPFDPLGRAFISSFSATTKVGASNYGTKTVTFDSKKKQGVPYSIVVEANDDKYAYPTFGAEKLKRIGKIPAVVESVTMDNSSLDFQNEAKTRTSWKLKRVDRIVIPTLLLPKIEVGELAEIDAKVVNEQTTFGFGRYLIYAVEHVMTSKGAKTITFLERRGVAKGK